MIARSSSHRPVASDEPLPRAAVLADSVPSGIDVASALHGLAQVHPISGEAPVARLRRERFELVIVSLQSPHAAELCCEASAFPMPLDVIVVTSHLDVASATTAIRLGAADIVAAGEGDEALRKVAARLLGKRALRCELERLERTEASAESLTQLLGESAAMRDLRETLRRAAESSATVLITGESGTGKELVARALHREGGRKEKPFVAISCGAIPANLLEDEFFGHKKGAFTHAERDRDGLLAVADGGTLFLDQMSDLPLDVQAKLLRALQERCFRPLGGGAERPFDARVIVATRKDLGAEVLAGRFRKDLYFRLKVIEIRLPALREMREDLLPLAHHFVRRAVRPGGKVLGLSLAAARALLRYDWPGNVRELEHCMTAAVAVARHERLCLSDLPEAITRNRSERHNVRVEPLREIEEQHILRVLDSVSGNKALAARILGVDRKTLHRKVVLSHRGDSPPRPAFDSRPG